jgi:hypothetical protein
MGGLVCLAAMAPLLLFFFVVTNLLPSSPERTHWGLENGDCKPPGTGANNQQQFAKWSPIPWAHRQRQAVGPRSNYLAHDRAGQRLGSRARTKRVRSKADPYQKRQELPSSLFVMGSKG